MVLARACSNADIILAMEVAAVRQSLASNPIATAFIPTFHHFLDYFYLVEILKWSFLHYTTPSLTDVFLIFFQFAKNNEDTHKKEWDFFTSEPWTILVALFCISYEYVILTITNQIWTYLDMLKDFIFSDNVLKYIHW